MFQNPDSFRCMISFVLVMGMTGIGRPNPAGSKTDKANPFWQKWETPFEVPPFHLIQAGHFMPAFEEGIARQRAEVEAIGNNPEPAEFANTIEALDLSGDFLDRVSGVFYSLNSAETSDAIQETAQRVAPLLSELRNDILMNAALFARVKAVWEKRAGLGLLPEQLRLVEETYKDFVRGGATLGADKKKRLRTVSSELSVLSVRFANQMLKETNAYRLMLDSKDDLAGLPENSVAAAAEAARAAGLEGKWAFTLQAPSIWPFLTFSARRDLRKQILEAYIRRGDNGNENDNKSILVKIAVLRAEKAGLLGYRSHADFVLERNMAKNPEGVYGLLNRIWAPALGAAKKEAADIQAMMDNETGAFKLEPWDWRYYSEKVKKARYDLDENELRPYFALENVMRAAFDVAGRLYGIRFTERTDLPKYHGEVRTFEVGDGDGSHLGVFYADYHPRPGKRGGAWSGGFRDQYVKNGTDIRPIVTNVCNFTRPAGGIPALMTLEEVETLFHEFGHALHGLLQKTRSKSLGVPRDFVELPSQIMEHWAMEPEVLRTYARHWKTGEPIPDTLIARIKRAEKFNQGFATTEYLAASYLDMDWHMLSGTEGLDANAFEKASLEKIGLIPEIIVRYRSPYFAHIFSGGYSSGYYSYIWSEVLDTDAFQAFREKGLFDQATAMSFRRNILETGGGADAMEMYLKFRGREPSVEPLLEKRGLK
jgi:peptidyl-dipeptidase Dcp